MTRRASLEHPNITRLIDGGISSGGDPYLVTEYVDGRPLDQYCDERRLPVEERLRLFLQVCHAVSFAHRNMIVHRDLKPANILVNREGTVKLLDFGTASLAVAEEAAVTCLHMLTPRYASPEQLRGERTGVASDCFALGVILYELLAERPVSYYSPDELSIELATDKALAGVPGSSERLRKVEQAVRAGTESPVDRIRYDCLLESWKRTPVRASVQKSFIAPHWPRRRGRHHCSRRRGSNFCCGWRSCFSLKGAGRRPWRLHDKEWT